MPRAKLAATLGVLGREKERLERRGVGGSVCGGETPVTEGRREYLEILQTYDAFQESLPKPGETDVFFSASAPSGENKFSGRLF